MRLKRPSAFATVLLAAALCSTGLAAEPPAAERADVAVYSGGVDFLPQVPYRQALLTVSGNGQTYRYTLAPHQQVSIGLFDPAGRLLADGTYRWQLELLPTETAAERLRAEALANDGRPLEPWRAQSGSFTVRGGIIADPALIEPGERAAASRRGERQGTSFSAVSFALSRRSAGDDDDAVGFREEVEARVSAASRSAPAAGSSALRQVDRAATDDSDATTATHGRSLERAATSDIQTSAQTRRTPVPRPRSDGSNGRPRSDG